MASWFRKSALESLPVAMSGVKLADRLLVIGASDPALAAALAAKVGLTGRACVVDKDRARAQHAAEISEREGALMEAAHYERGAALPYPDEAFDVAVVRDRKEASIDDPTTVLSEVWRVLRPGGRCVVIEGTARAGVGALLRGTSKSTLDAGAVNEALRAAGFLAVRTLAEREGMLFVEGVKQNAAISRK